MEQTVINKLKRFVELSAKFTKSAEDVFGKEMLSSHSNVAYVGSESQFVITSGNKQSTVSPTRAEKIKAEAEIKAQLADEYDEYISLQKDLQEYFNIIDKLSTTNNN